MAEQRFPSIWLHQHRVQNAGLMDYTVELTCPGCQRVRGFDPYALWWLFEQRGWDDQEALPVHSLLRQNTSRGAPTVRITDDTLGHQPEREWEKSIKRHRT